MKNLILLLVTILGHCLTKTQAQLQVSREPFHRPVFQNKYVRILDVILPPNDTTQFHVHSTPSLFIYLSTNNTGTQIKGKGWTTEQSVPGKAWYRSFSPDSLIHRVANLDTLPFHVNDIEILSSYLVTGKLPAKPLPFPVLFENEKSLAYQLSNQHIAQKITIDHGPLIAELVTGTGVSFHDLKTKETKEIKEGQYLYIDPETAFYFAADNSEPINLIIFEIR